MSCLAKIEELRPEMIRAAQAVLDDWHQDENGLDDVLGAGGACQDVAAAICDVLAGQGVEEIATCYTEFDGGHVFLMALLDEGAFMVDIPPSVYETGAGYAWTKKAGVQLESGHIRIDRMEPPMSAAEFRYRYCENSASEPAF